MSILSLILTVIYFGAVVVSGRLQKRPELLNRRITWQVGALIAISTALFVTTVLRDDAPWWLIAVQVAATAVSIFALWATLRLRRVLARTGGAA